LIAKTLLKTTSSGPQQPDSFVWLVPQLGDDVDYNPTRKRGTLPEYRPSLTLFEVAQ
jgi:hypothetical protein